MPTGQQQQGIVGTATGLVNKASGWVDQLFGFFGLYTTQYSKYIVYALLLLVGSKMFKFKFNIDTRGKK